MLYVTNACDSSDVERFRDIKGGSHEAGTTSKFNLDQRNA